MSLKINYLKSSSKMKNVWLKSDGTCMKILSCHLRRRQQFIEEFYKDKDVSLTANAGNGTVSLKVKAVPVTGLSLVSAQILMRCRLLKKRTLNLNRKMTVSCMLADTTVILLIC